MSTARDYLAAVQQRADLCSHYQGVAGDLGRTDVPRLVAALGGVIELIEAWEVGSDVGYDQNETVELMVEKAHARELRAAITDALTPKENDS